MTVATTPIRAGSTNHAAAAPAAALPARPSGYAPTAVPALPQSAVLRTGYARQRLRAWPVGVGGRLAGELDERDGVCGPQRAPEREPHGVGGAPGDEQCPSSWSSSPSQGQRR